MAIEDVAVGFDQGKLNSFLGGSNESVSDSDYVGIDGDGLSAFDSLLKTGDAAKAAAAALAAANPGLNPPPVPPRVKAGRTMSG